MKKRTGIQFVLIPLVTVFALYLVFSSRITCKPNQAGFWLILALGMSIGVALTHLFKGLSKKDTQ